MAASASVPGSTPVSAPSPDHILQTGLAFWASKTLLSAVEMEVFTELARGPEEGHALAGRLGLHPRSSRDFLDALVALGFLEREDGNYRNTPSTDMFLDKRKPFYIGGMLEMANQRLYGHWGRLTLALRTGNGKTKCQGSRTCLPRSMPIRPGSRLFARHDRSEPRRQISPSHRKFPWTNYKTVADCGTAQGDLIVQVALKNPHLDCVGFDLAEVAPIFEEYVEENGLASRVRFQPGNFFQRPAAQRGRDHDGAHPARLESRRKEDADPQGVRGAATRRSVHRL